MTKREKILSFIKSVVDGVSSVSGRVYRTRVVSFDRANTPAISIEPISDEAEISELSSLDWSMLIRIAIVTRGLIPDQLADPIISEVHALLMADTSLGGDAMDFYPVSVNFELLEGDQPVGVISLGYRVIYRTQVQDLSA